MALLNAKLSQRGAIRRSNNVVTWAGVVCQLRESGLTDASVLIKRWNQMSGMAKENQLVGQKRTALLNLLALDTKILTKLLSLVGECGWDHCPFTEDFFAGNKLKVGHTMRVGCKEWQDRLRISADSIQLLVELLTCRYKKLPYDAWKKMSRVELEELSHVTAMCHNLAQELTAELPVPPFMLEQVSASILLLCLHAVLAWWCALRDAASTGSSIAVLARSDASRQCCRASTAVLARSDVQRPWCFHAGLLLYLYAIDWQQCFQIHLCPILSSTAVLARSDAVGWCIGWKCAGLV